MDERRSVAEPRIMRHADWPHGLRCGECDEEITDGERYSTVLEGFLEDVPIALVVCVTCGLRPNAAA